jgi:hypothetical protein
MSITGPVEGDSINADVPGVKGVNTVGGTGVYGLSIGGAAGHFEGNVEITGDISAKEFRLADGQAGAPGLAKQVADLLLQVQALKNELDAFKAGFRIASGKTVPGATAWQVYAPGAITLHVDTSSGRFRDTPAYITSIGGDNLHWATTGATSIYSATPTGFQIFIKFSDGSALTPQNANLWKWHINWIALGV